MTKTKCPACGLAVAGREAEESPHAFHCAHCNAHIVLRDAHLHLVWNKRTPLARDKDEDTIDDD